MKLKFYLRGLGIGIVVTALIMGFVTKDAGQMSDEEVKARAKELGMVEQMTLADIRDNEEAGEQSKDQGEEVVQPTKESAENIKPEDNKEENNEGQQEIEVPQVTKEPVTTEVPVMTQAPATEAPAVTEAPITDVPSETAVPPVAEAGETEAPDGNGAETEIPLPTAEVMGDTVHITIFEGNNSVNVSKVLAEAGLVENASTFDRYLRNNGYSKIINTGEYRIDFGTSEAEIARIITNTD